MEEKCDQVCDYERVGGGKGEQAGAFDAETPRPATSLTAGSSKQVRSEIIIVGLQAIPLYAQVPDALVSS